MFQLNRIIYRFFYTFVIDNNITKLAKFSIRKIENKVQTSFVSSTDVPDFSDMEIVFDVQNRIDSELWELDGLINSDIVHESKLLENNTRYRETRSNV